MCIKRERGYKDMECGRKREREASWDSACVSVKAVKLALSASAVDRLGTRHAAI